MALFERFVLLRHSQAGEKNPNPVEDVGRALDSDGMKIAMSLAEVITTHLAPEVIVSSPYKRCLQTVGTSRRTPEPRRAPRRTLGAGQCVHRYLPSAVRPVAEYGGLHMER